MSALALAGVAVVVRPGTHANRVLRHAGLGPGDTRPSQGRSVHRPSAAHRALVDADVVAVLPPELRRLWLRPVGGGPTPTGDAGPAGPAPDASDHPRDGDGRPPR